jgi:nucleoside-diphosphate-sugar epimerase
VKTAFVTGGTGFVGINLVNELVNQGWSVTCLHRSSSDLKYLGRLPVQRRVGDLHDPGSLRAAIPADVDVVFHVAGDTSAWSKLDAAQSATNVLGTRNVIDAARSQRAKRFVLTSTASAYGPQTAPLSEASASTADRSWINYERSKWLSEQEVRKAGASGLDFVIMQPCAVFGPYDTSVWGNVFKVIRDGKMAALPPGRLPINHVHEVARAHVAAAERAPRGEHYILNGDSEPLARIFREMAKLMGIDLRAKVLPAFVFRTMGRIAGRVAAWTGKGPDMTAEMADLLCRDSIVITDKAERELGYRRVPLERCLKDSYDWLKSEGEL